MKITVPLKTLAEFVEKSAVGALTSDAQDEERKKIRPTDSCVRITASKDSISFESSSPEISALYSMPKDDSVIIDKEGSFCVEASHYLKVLKTLSSSRYSIQISYEENKNYGKDAFGGIIQPNGKITTIAVDNKNKAERRKLHDDTFPVSEFTQVDYNHSKVLFSIGAKTLKDSIDRVMFATDPTDLSELLDRVAIVVSGKKIYVAVTDGKRVAIVFVDENGKDVEIKSNDQKILIDGILLKNSCKSFDDDEKIEIIDCEDKEHIILFSEKIKIRLCIASDEVKQQFPNFLNILNIVLPITLVADKADLLEAVEVLSLYNAEKSISYITGVKSEFKIDAARRGTDPETALAECEPITASLENPIAMSNSFIIDGCKKISGPKVKLSFTKDEKKIKMESPTDTNFVYLMQSMTPN
jgi:DNA polymerase III sliding clamp (beta) subunit (PCNA family)